MVYKTILLALNTLIPSYPNTYLPKDIKVIDYRNWKLKLFSHPNKALRNPALVPNFFSASSTNCNAFCSFSPMVNYYYIWNVILSHQVSWILSVWKFSWSLIVMLNWDKKNYYWYRIDILGYSIGWWKFRIKGPAECCPQGGMKILDFTSSPFWPLFTILTHFHHSDLFSPFWPFHHFDPFSPFWPIFTILTRFHHFDPNLKCPKSTLLKYLSA